MADKEIKTSWMGQKEATINRRSKGPIRGSDLILYITAGVVLASIITATGHHIYNVYQTNKAIKAYNESLEQLEQEMRIKALEWELEARRALQPQVIRIPAVPNETYQERQIRGERARQNFERNQTMQQHCQFWMGQQPSERRNTKMAEYCR